MNFINGIKLKIKQQLVNIEFKRNGLTDSVLEKQLKINNERNKLDITDSGQRIYKNFVQ